MNNYQNFFIQTVTRSLQTALSSLTSESALSNDIRDRALTALDLAFKPQVATASWPTTRELVLALSPQMEQAGHWDDWQPYLQQALSISQAAQDVQTEAAIGIQIGVFLQRQGHLESSLHWFHMSIERAQVANDSTIWASALNRLGLISLTQHKVAEASAYAEQALELISEDNPQREDCYMVLGNVALSMQELEGAEKYFQDSINICRYNGDNSRMATNLNNLGIAQHWQGMYQEALVTYEQAARFWQELNNQVELAVIKMNQGLVYDSLDDPQTALRYYSEAKPILEKAQNSLNLAKLYNNQGYCYYKLQRWEEAKEIYLASLTQWQQLKNWFEYANTLDGLGLVYHEQGRYKEAFQTFQDALQFLSKISEEYVIVALVQEIRGHLEKSYVALG